MLANVAMGMLSANAWKVVCYVAIRVMSDAPEHIEVCISVKLILSLVHYGFFFLRENFRKISMRPA